MSKVKLIPNHIRVEGQKRQYIPYVLEFTCNCGFVTSKDLSGEDDWYFSEPILNDENHLWICCEQCEKETKLNIRLNITAEFISAE